MIFEQINVDTKKSAGTLISIPKQCIFNNLMMILDPTHERYTIVAFTNEFDKKILIGAIYLRLIFLKSADNKN